METDAEMMERLQRLSANPESWDEEVSPDDKAAIRRALELIERYRAALERADRIATGEDQVALDDSEGMGVIHREIAAALSQDPPPARR